MTILKPEFHERVYQEAIKTEVEAALGELGLTDYRVRLDPYENRADLFILNNVGREILVIEVKKVKRDVLSPRYWDQARKYVLNSTNWDPNAPRVFSITNAEELCVFCLREDFTHIKYCLLKNGKISNGDFGPNGEADTVLTRFRGSIKRVLSVCLAIVPIEYDENWFPILEKFRIERDNLSSEVLESLDQALHSNEKFHTSFKTWADSLYPYYTEHNKKRKISEEVAATTLFKTLCYEVIRDLLRNVPLNEINNVRLSPINQATRTDLIDTLAQLYTDILRIDYRQLFEADKLSNTLSLSAAGRASLESFVTALGSVSRARGETSDSEFLIESLIDTIIPPWERHSSGLTVEDKQMSSLLAHICIKDHHEKVIDIASGTCAILGAAYDRLKKLKIDEGQHTTHDEIIGQISAIESNQFIAKVGLLRLILKDLLDETQLDLHIKDAFSVVPLGDKDVILCNPPYLRQADIPNDYKEMMREAITTHYDNQDVEGNFPYSIGQADKYFYFVEWGLLFIKPGGMAGFILSDKFLNSRNGVNLKRFLLEQTNIISIIKYSGKFFEGFDVTTCFVIVQRKNGGTLESDNLTRFIRLHGEISEEKLLEFLESEEDINTSEARVVVESQSRLSADEKWGKKLISLPLSYGDCYTREFMEELDTISGGINKRGKDNGCNGVFFPTSKGFTKGRGEPEDDFKDRKDQYKDRLEVLVEGIEQDFLHAGINSGNLPRHFILEDEDTTHELLLVVPPSTELEEFSGLQEFIDFAEETYIDSEGEERAILDGNKIRIPDRPTIKGRDPWYSLYNEDHEEDKYALIIPRMHRAKFKILIPQSETFFSTNFVGFGSIEDIDTQDIKFLAGFLMSSLGQLQFEVEGDWREGLLKIEAGQMYRLKAPDPSHINESDKVRVVEKFETLHFGVNGLEGPGSDNPRFELDKAVMNLFFPQELCEVKTIEIEEALYQTVLERDPENNTR